MLTCFVGENFDERCGETLTVEPHAWFAFVVDT